MLEVLPPKTRIEKVNSEPGDLTANGARGTIVNRIGPFQENGETKLGDLYTWVQIFSLDK